jgi:hypothetical protein
VYKLLYPKKDAAIHELHPYRNSGVDQIIDITKFAIGEQYDDVIDPLASWGETYNSRILMQFDLNDIQRDISLGIIDTGSAKYYLKLYAAEATALQTEYTLYAYPIAQSWVNGNGNYNDEPEIRNGVSWAYRLKYNSGSWDSSSGSMSFTSNSGGGTWNSNYAASQSFSFESPDVRMDVTSIVKAWLSGSVVNNGMIIKHSQEAETNDLIYGSLKFFSRETHTIYVPTLQVLWDSNSNYSGSFSTKTQLTESFTVYCKNLKSKYPTNTKAKLRFGVRDTYVTKTYNAILESTPERRLPDTTYYSIVDIVTGIDIVPFDTVGTKLDMDNNGYYLTLDTSNLMPIRFYKIILKVVDVDDNEILIDNNFAFRIEN